MCNRNMSGPVDVNSLQPQQLKQLFDSLEEEVGYLTNSLTQLKAAQERFVGSAATLEALKPESDGNDIMVPLTSSLYVPGKLNAQSMVTVDIGTGYYLQKTIPGAKEFFTRRATFLKSKIEELQPVVMSKVKEKNMVEGALQSKMQAMQGAGGKK